MAPALCSGQALPSVGEFMGESLARYNCGMVCQGCGVREATTLVQTIAHNQLKKLALCSDCAAALAPAAELDALMQALAGVPRSRAHPARCPSCRAGYSDFRETGRFGCPDCYAAFAPQVRDLLPRVHAGAYHHRGKTPGRR
jgi:protein arginine kinase activator